MHPVIDEISIPRRESRRQEAHLVWQRLKRGQFYYGLAVLPLLYFVIFRYLPMFGVIIAFEDYDPFMGVSGIFDPKIWVGLKHFRNFFSSVFFWQVLRNTLVLSFMKLIWGFPAPIILALMINEVMNKFLKRSVQLISYLPHFFSMVVVAGMVKAILTVQGGLLNQVIVLFGGEPIALFIDPRAFRAILVVTTIWQEVGWGSILYLAAISDINPELYEAAMVDGANKLQQMRHITLPSISYVIAILLIFRIGGLLDAGFQQVLLLYSPSVYGVADVIDTYVYRAGLLGRQYSYAAAVGLFKSVLALVLLVAANKVAKKVGQPGVF